VCAAGSLWVDELNGYHIYRGTISASPSAAAFSFAVGPDSDRRRLGLDVASVVTAPRWFGRGVLAHAEDGTAGYTGR